MITTFSENAGHLLAGRSVANLRTAQSSCSEDLSYMGVPLDSRSLNTMHDKYYWPLMVACNFGTLRITRYSMFTNHERLICTRFMFRELLGCE